MGMDGEVPGDGVDLGPGLAGAFDRVHQTARDLPTAHGYPSTNDHQFAETSSPGPYDCYTYWLAGRSYVVARHTLFVGWMRQAWH